MPMTGIETVAVNTAPEFTYTEWPSTNSAFNSPNEIILVLRIETSGTYPVTFTNLTGGATTTVTGQCPFTDNPYPYSAGVSGAGFTCYAIITPTNGVYTYTYAATIYGVTESANVVLTAGGNAPIAIASPTATSPVDAGQTISLSANGVSGGTGSYTTEQWYDAGTARENSTGTHVGPGNSLSATDTQPNTGVYYYYLVVSGGTDTAITPAISVTVDQAPTTTSVSCPAFTAGTPTTCTATVSGYNPTGTVSFTPGTATDSFSPASCTLAASGGSYTCQVSYTDTAAETPSITASYSGDTNNLASSSSASVTVLSYTAPTTTVSNGGGGGGGGGGPTGVSPTFVPTVTTSGNSCYVATPVAWLDTFTFHIGGTTISVLDNFISPNETGVQIGSQTYTLLENQPQSISGANATIELTNVSYLPIEHTVTLMLCPVSGASPLQPSLNSTTNSTTGNLTVQTSPVTTTVLPTIPTTSTVPAAVLTTTTVKPSGFGYLYYLLLAIVVVLLLLIFAYYRRRRKRDGKTN